MQNLWELNERCRRTGVALGLGLSPFEIYLNYDADAKRALRSKVLQINKVGPETLCILFVGKRHSLGEILRRQLASIGIGLYTSLDAKVLGGGVPPESFLA